MLNTPLPRLSTDSIGGLVLTNGELRRSHAIDHSATETSSFHSSGGRTLVQDRKVMQLRRVKHNVGRPSSSRIVPTTVSPPLGSAAFTGEAKHI